MHWSYVFLALTHRYVNIMPIVIAVVFHDIIDYLSLCTRDTTDFYLNQLYVCFVIFQQLFITVHSYTGNNISVQHPDISW